MTYCAFYAKQNKLWSQQSMQKARLSSGTRYEFIERAIICHRVAADARQQAESRGDNATYYAHPKINDELKAVRDYFRLIKLFRDGKIGCKPKFITQPLCHTAAV